MNKEWWVIQANSQEQEYAIGPFPEKELAEKWKRQAILPADKILNIVERQNAS